MIVVMARGSPEIGKDCPSMPALPYPFPRKGKPFTPIIALTSHTVLLTLSVRKKLW